MERTYAAAAGAGAGAPKSDVAGLLGAPPPMSDDPPAAGVAPPPPPPPPKREGAAGAGVVPVEDAAVALEGLPKEREDGNGISFLGLPSRSETLPTPAGPQARVWEDRTQRVRPRCRLKEPPVRRTALLLLRRLSVPPPSHHRQRAHRHPRQLQRHSRPASALLRQRGRLPLRHLRRRQRGWPAAGRPASWSCLRRRRTRRAT
jgi:hypothetical protein